MPQFTYATRRSALALAQCRAFVARLEAAHPSVDLVELQVVTTGDKIQDRPLAELGGKGLFVKEIEEALLARTADFAVHSIKDVPSVLPEGLRIACIPKREDPRDVLVSPRYGSLAALPKGARVGTGSLRRTVALRAVRADLEIVPIRGNVDTRLRKVNAGEFDAIVLARAGLVRLGLELSGVEILAPDVSLPAVGQGALGIETRSADASVTAWLGVLHDDDTSRCVSMERGVMLALEGDCKTPLGAFAERVNGGSVHMRAFIADPDGSNVRRKSWNLRSPSSDEDAHAAGVEMGRELISN